MSIDPETPAKEVKKHPANPTRIMVLMEGPSIELGMV
jgi:hypothetical protein